MGAIFNGAFDNSERLAKKRLPRVRIYIVVATYLAILLSLVGCARLGEPEGWSKGIVVDDVLYIGTMEGDLRALDIYTGETIWTFELRAEESQKRAIYGTPSVVEDILYIGGYDGRLYAISLTDTEDRRQIREVWDVLVGDGDPIVGSPIVADGLVLVGSSDGSMYAFDSFDGSLQWAFQTANKIWSTPVVLGGVAYFGSLDHKLYAVSLEDGKAVWQSPFSAKGAITARPLISQGRLYVGAFDSVFYAIDMVTGRETGRFEGARNWYWADAVASGDLIFAPSLDGNLYALDRETLEPRWEFETDSPIIGSPVLVSNYLAIPSLDGRVRLVGINDGYSDHQCNLGTKLRASLAAHQNVIYLAAGDHSIRALMVKQNGNPDEEWVHFTEETPPVPRDWTRSC